MKIDLLLQEQPGLNSCIIIPFELLSAFREVVRRGMAYEHGQPQELFDFCDRLGIPGAPPSVVSPIKE
jgi:hypothetical protein